MNKKALSILAVLMLLTVSAGCRGKSSDSGQTPGSGGDQPSFNVNGAKQLVALSNTIAPASSTSGAKGFFAALFGKNNLFTYRIVNQGLTDEQVRARAKGMASELKSAAATTQQIGSNLLSIDASGNATLAISSNYMIKVMYSVADPDGQYVYFALDTGLIKPDGNDYTQFIAQNNCAFYKVSLVDNSYSCVKEGVYVQPMDDIYLQRVSGNQKPIQFDTDGNMYFPGTSFVRRCDGSGQCTMTAADWNPRIYRVSKSDNSVIALTQDNQKIYYYLVLSTGEIAYQSINPQTDTITLYLWQKGIDPTINPNGKTINLTGNAVAVDFFTVDTYNTIMWGGWSDGGIRFARPAASGLIEKATLDTTIFKSSGSSGGDNCSINLTNSYPPSRVIVGDDGKLYGVFQDGVSKPDPANPDTYKCYTSLKVYQVLPYNAVQKTEILLDKNAIMTLLEGGGSGLQWMGATPFQVSNGFIYYKETTEKLGYGNRDILKMVSLTDRRTITLLTNNAYEIYTWRLKGDTLYFSALDMDQTIVVAGEINTATVQANPLADPLTTFMKVTPIASAIGANSRVQDIESVVPVTTATVTDPPKVKAITASPENIYSVSVEFNKDMNKASVESNLAFKDVTNSKNIATMKVWIKNFLHLIPDLDVNNATDPPAPDDSLLDLAHTTPLSFKTDYEIDLAAGATDAGGTALVSAASQTFETRPEFGWYVSQAGVGKYAGAADTTSYTPETYDLYTDNTATSKVPVDFRVQFRARNYGYEGIRVVLYDNTQPVSALDYIYTQGSWTYTDPGSDSDRPVVSVDLNSNTNVYYQTTTDWGRQQTNAWSNYDPLVFNGEWTYYRIDLYGNTLVVSYSQDGIDFSNKLTFQTWDSTAGVYRTSDSITPVFSRDANHTYKLFLRVRGAVDIDDLKVYELSSNGLVGTLWESIDFNNLKLPGSTDMPAGPNIPDLVTNYTYTTYPGLSYVY